MKIAIHVVLQLCFLEIAVFWLNLDARTGGGGSS